MSRHLASALAKILLPSNKWPELLQFISQCATHADWNHRELAYILLVQLSETVATALAPELPRLAGLFQTALQDQERPVAVAASGVLCICANFVHRRRGAAVPGPRAAHGGRSAPSSFGEGRQRPEAVLRLLLRARPDAGTRFTPHITTVVSLSLEVMKASDDDLERTTRDGAASVVGCIAEWKPKLLGKANLVTPVVHACCEIMVRADASAKSGGGAGALFVSTPLQRLRQEEKAPGASG